MPKFYWNDRTSYEIKYVCLYVCVCVYIYDSIILRKVQNGSTLRISISSSSSLPFRVHRALYTTWYSLVSLKTFTVKGHI